MAILLFNVENANGNKEIKRFKSKDNCGKCYGRGYTGKLVGSNLHVQCSCLKPVLEIIEKKNEPILIGSNFIPTAEKQEVILENE